MFGFHIQPKGGGNLPKLSDAGAQALLDAVYHWSDLLADKEIPAVEILRCVIVQQFYVNEQGIRWRTGIEGLPPSMVFINSPSDLDALLAEKSGNFSGPVTKFI